MSLLCGGRRSYQGQGCDCGPRPGDSVPGEYQVPLVEKLDMANYECKCLSANHPPKILSRDLQCIFFYIPCFDPGITSPAFQVAMHWVIVLVLKEKGQHMVAFIVFLPRFYSMHNLFQGCLPMGLTKWPITAPSIHSELHSTPFANFQRIRVDMGGSTSKYVPYMELLLDCTSLHLLEAMLLSHPSIIALLMELCPWHIMGAKIQLSRDTTADAHAGTSPVVLIGIPLPMPFLVLHSHSVEPLIAHSVTKGMMQLYNQSSSVDSLAAPIMSSGSYVHLRSNVITSMLQSSVVIILSILKMSVAQSCAMRCCVEVEHGVLLSTKASTAILQLPQCVVTKSSDFGCIIMKASFQAAQRLHATLLCMQITNASRCYTGWVLAQGFDLAMFTELALVHKAYLQCAVDGDFAHCTSCAAINGPRLATVVQLILVVVQHFTVSALYKMCAVGNSGGIQDLIWTVSSLHWAIYIASYSGLSTAF